MRKLIVFLVCFGLPAVAKAGSHEYHASKEFRILKELNFKEGGFAFVMVREGGHLLGQPYQVELRVECSGSVGHPYKVNVKDSFSVCDMDPKSIKVNKNRTAVAMKVKMFDVSDYDEQIGRGVASPEMRCLKKTTIKKFSLKKLCD